MIRLGRAAAVVLIAGVAGFVVADRANAQSLAVGKKIEVNVNADTIADDEAKLWATYGGWCAIKDWHPAIKDCKESKEGNDTFRTLTLADGGIIKEKLVEMQKRLYRYEIIESPLPVKNYSAQFALTPDDDDADELNFAWSAVFDAKDKPDREARDVIDGIFKDGLESIRKATSAGKADKD